jgi:hypothetical protein
MKERILNNPRNLDPLVGGMMRPCCSSVVKD